jgi:Tol biopolymer transport system component
LGVSLLPDKNAVVFSAAVTATPLGISDIYTMNLDGANLKKIVTNGTNNFYSPQVR